MVVYLDTRQGGVGRATGLISVIERDGKVVEVVIETDGSAVFIKASDVIAYEEEQ